MTKLQAAGQHLTLVEVEDLTSGSERYYMAEFGFDSTWDGMERTAVFKTYFAAVSVLLDATGACKIPGEVLTDGDIPLEISVFGVLGGEVVLTTNYVSAGTIIKGADRAAAGREPTPGVYEQILGLLDDMPSRAEVDAIKDLIPRPMTAEELRKILNGGH